MKMSFFWAVMFGLNLLSVISDIANNDFGLFFYISLAALLLTIWFCIDARRNELREAAAKKQFINIVINHMNNEPADATAKRVAEQMRYTL